MVTNRLEQVNIITVLGGCSGATVYANAKFYIPRSQSTFSKWSEFSHFLLCKTFLLLLKLLAI